MNEHNYLISVEMIEPREGLSRDITTRVHTLHRRERRVHVMVLGGAALSVVALTTLHVVGGQTLGQSATARIEERRGQEEMRVATEPAAMRRATQVGVREEMDPTRRMTRRVVSPRESRALARPLAVQSGGVRTIAVSASLPLLAR